MLRKKVQELDQKVSDLENAAEKIQQADMELEFLRNEVENERRKSTVDQNKLRKMEILIAEKEKKF